MKRLAFNSRRLLVSGLFIALTTMGGWIRIPFFPVPMTLQTLFVYLSGTLLGARQGALCQGLFVVLGLAGFPLFTTGGGLRTLLQPTFGYLLGFPVAAGLIGFLTRQPGSNMHLSRLISAMASGSLALFALGVAHLFIYTQWIVGHHVNWVHLMWTGMILFIPSEVLKIMLAGTLTLKLSPIAESLRSDI